MARSEPPSQQSLAVARRLTPRGRSSTYSMLLGLALGSLLMGAVVPFAVGDAPRDVLSADVPAALDPATGVVGTESGRGAVGGPSPLASVPGAAAGGPAGGTAGSPVVPGGSAPGAAGGAGTGAPAPGGGSQPSGAKGVPLRATDRGVTATTVKVGVIIPDVGSLGSFGFGFATVPDPEGKAQAVFDRINETGGLNGRKAVPVLRRVDVVDQNAMRRACLAFANDDKVFAVLSLGGFYGPAVRCVAIDTKTPIVKNDSSPTSDYQAGRGYIVTAQQDVVRDSANLADRLNQLGLLKGRKFGVLNWAGYDEASKRGFIPVARSLGANIVSQYTLSGDLQQGASQIPIAVAQFQRDGVDTVILAVNLVYGTQFVQTAQNQGAQFRYHTSDDQGGSTDGWISQMPQSFDGTIGIHSRQQGEARAGLPPTKPNEACVANYLKRSYATKYDPKERNQEYDATTSMCLVGELFTNIARAAGPELTRARFAAAVATLGTSAYPAMPGPLTFGPGKFSGGDHHHVVRADMSCKCWRLVNKAPATRDRY